MADTKNTVKPKATPTAARAKAPRPADPASAPLRGPAAPPASPVAVAPPAPLTAPVPVVPPASVVTPGDERTWGMLAHLSVLLNLFTGIAGPIAALVIYLIYRNRSRQIAYHSLQAMIFQLIWWFGGGALIGLMWAAVGILSTVLIGILLVPLALIGTLVFGILPLGALIYGLVGAVQVSQGQDFKYWLVGDWVRGTLTG